MRAMRSMQSSSSSTGEISFDPIMRRNSTADLASKLSEGGMSWNSLMYERGRHSMPRYLQSCGEISGGVMAVTNRFLNALALLIVAASASAAYPDRPLRYILGSAAGGGPDVA